MELVLNTPAGAAVAERIAPPAESLHAPHLVSVEVAHALRRLAELGSVRTTAASDALRDATDLDIIRYDHEVLLPRVWELRKNLTAYDAVYVALAEALDAPLLTADRRLARSRGHRATIEVVA